MQCYRTIRVWSQAKTLGAVTSTLSKQAQSLENRQWFHATANLERPRSKVVGDRNFQPYLQDKLAPPKWKHLWLLMMRRKDAIEEKEELKPRSDQVNWNYEAELLAFAHRLHLNVGTDLLKIAFTEPIDNEEIKETCNSDLVNMGREFLDDFVRFYIGKVFPEMTADCVESVVGYLTSEELLSDLAQNLGHADLVQSPEFPIALPTLKRSFLATVGAVLTGEDGRVEAARFVSDFVIAELIDKDIVHDIWRPKNPMGILAEELRTRKMPSPDVRLTRQSGITTILPVYFVGIFLDEKLFAESGGESVTKAETDAAKLALKKLYDISIQRYLPNYNLLDDPDVRQELTGKYFDRQVSVEL